MQGQYLQIGTATPSIELAFINPTTGLPRTDLAFGTSGLTIGYRRPGAAVVNVTLVTQTVTGAWAAGGFVHLGGGVYRLDLPAAAALTGVNRLVMLAVALPTDVVMVPIEIALSADDLSAAAATDASIAAASATAVRTSLSTELARIDAPVSGAVSTSTLTSQVAALRQALSVGAKFGGAASGGSSSVISVYDAGNSAVLLGTVIVYRDATGNVTGQSALTPP